MSTCVTSRVSARYDSPPVAFVNRLLHRRIASVETRLVLLAPPRALIPAAFAQIDVDERRHRSLVADVQRLRGRVYLDDGAIESNQLTPDGRHETPEDARSWHLLMVDRLGRVAACVWFLAHDPNVSSATLRVRDCPLTQQPAWRETLWKAVESELARARKAGLAYAEVGGWAVAESSRGTSEGLILALAAYSLGRLMGGTLGMTTATVRHCSSTILRRLGGLDLRVGERLIPSYYDPRYKCEMELLRFDSRHPNPKYSAIVDMLKEKLSDVPVLTRQRQRAGEPGYRSQFAAAV